MTKDERDLLRKPCAGCPFSRATTPEYMAKRRSSVRQFIGQAAGPMLLPCHTFADREKWPLDAQRPQCVGAAMYRDATGVADLMPRALTRAEHDPELVFSSSAEYLAHHEKCTVEEAEKILRTPGTRVVDFMYKEAAEALALNRKIRGL